MGPMPSPPHTCARQVIISEIDPICALQARMAGFKVTPHRTRHTRATCLPPSPRMLRPAGRLWHDKCHRRPRLLRPTPHIQPPPPGGVARSQCRGRWRRTAEKNASALRPCAVWENPNSAALTQRPHALMSAQDRAVQGRQLPPHPSGPHSHHMYIAHTTPI